MSNHIIKYFLLPWLQNQISLATKFSETKMVKVLRTINVLSNISESRVFGHPTFIPKKSMMNCCCRKAWRCLCLPRMDVTLMMKRIWLCLSPQQQSTEEWPDHVCLRSPLFPPGSKPGRPLHSWWDSTKPCCCYFFSSLFLVTVLQKHRDILVKLY